MAKTEQGFIIPDGVTGDLIVFTDSEGTGKFKVVLIDRKNAPLGRAIPGGFLDPNETLPQCAVREFLEECNVDLGTQPVTLVNVYSNPKRDPRARIISSAYMAVVPYEKLEALKANDDALSVELCDIDDVLNGKVEFAFSDHKQMIIDALEKL